MSSIYKRHFKTWLLLPFVALALGACQEDVSELGSPNAYDTADFLANYYVGRDDFADKTITNNASVSLDSTKIFAGLNETDFHGFPSIKTMYPALYDPKTLSVASDWNSADDVDSELEKAQSTSFGRHYCLVHWQADKTKQDDSFKRGVLSKLYNGQLHCDGYFSKARVQIDSDGYAAYFPKTMDSSEYFAVSARGGSNSTGGTSDRDVKMDVTVSFYKVDGNGYSKTDVSFSGIYFATDKGGSQTTLFGFKFADALPGFDPSGIVGMGISYSNVVDETYSPSDGVTTGHEKVEGKVNDALLLYEVMMINSSWH